MRIVTFENGVRVIRDALPHELPEPVSAEELLIEWRNTASCSRAQGKIALGEAEWNRFQELRNDADLPWAMRVAADDTYEWRRNSQAMDEFAWLMGYDALGMDDLFLEAMEIEI